MPLLLIVGIPCSGKSTRALQLAAHFQSKGLETIVVNEETLNFSKAEYYKNPAYEKILRGSLRSNVEKLLDSKRIVILDSLNYIKGFRYELYCLVRNSRTTLCLVCTFPQNNPGLL